MGRTPCCSKVGLHRGPWTTVEDTLLENCIQTHGEGHWKSLPEKAGLLRCGKSCRLRWLNYLRPDIRRGNITPDEDDLIIRLHSLLGNRWSLIAGRLPGRTDNEIKNYWNCHLSKRLKNKGNYKQDGDGKTITKAKVYLPKAVRIPFSSPFYADGNNGGEAKLACDHKDSDFVYDNDCHPCQNSEPTTDDMLDKIYKEYQQLLTAENQPSLGSFVDSLFI